ncbi:MAG: hypothetical protein ACI4EK_00630 [Wujia sp.]
MTVCFFDQWGRRFLAFCLSPLALKVEYGNILLNESGIENVIVLCVTAVFLVALCFGGGAFFGEIEIIVGIVLLVLVVLEVLLIIARRKIKL